MEENNIKALFFVQYFGQKVLKAAEDIERLYTVCQDQIGVISIGGWSESYLLLRTVEQLTDDECIKLAEIVIGDPFGRYRNMQVARNFAINGFPYIMIHHKNVTYKFQIDCTLINFTVLELEDDICSQIDMKPYACIDYLRSIGILIPLTYLNEENKPVTLQTQELIALKWVVIK